MHSQQNIKPWFSQQKTVWATDKLRLTILRGKRKCWECNCVLSTKDCNWTLYSLLTPWCRVLLEKLTGLQLVKKFPAFHGTRRFITALTSVRHLSLSWARPIQSIYPHPTSWRSILILFTHLRLGLPSGILPSGFPTKTLYTPLSHAQPISFFSILSPAQ